MISIIPLNVSVLNLPLQRQKLSEWIEILTPTTCGLEEALLVLNIDRKACIYMYILKVCTQTLFYRWK